MQYDTVNKIIKTLNPMERLRWRWKVTKEPPKPPWPLGTTEVLAQDPMEVNVKPHQDYFLMKKTLRLLIGVWSLVVLLSLVWTVGALRAGSMTEARLSWVVALTLAGVVFILCYLYHEVQQRSSGGK